MHASFLAVDLLKRLSCCSAGPQDPPPDTPPKISAFQDAPDWAKEMPSWGDKPQPSSLNGIGDAKSGTSSSLPPVLDANDAAVPKTGPFDMFSAQAQSEVGSRDCCGWLCWPLLNFCNVETALLSHALRMLCCGWLTAAT